MFSLLIAPSDVICFDEKYPFSLLNFLLIRVRNSKALVKRRRRRSLLNNFRVKVKVPDLSCHTTFVLINYNYCSWDSPVEVG